MMPYELMIKSNDFMIKGGTFTVAQKQNIVNRFLAVINNQNEADRFYRAVMFPGNIDGEGRRMYPLFYLPPYNDGKKFQTVMTVTPKTHILSANSYELEIIRLLYILAPQNELVKEMVSQTLGRLKTTCFGNQDDGVGECFETSIVVLRFLAAVAPDEIKWIKERIENFHKYFSQKHRHWGVKWYYWLCLSEMPIEIAEPEILKFKYEILTQLNRSYVMNSDSDKATHPMIICMIRNLLTRLPEYEYIKERKPYIDDKDGRLYFDMRNTESQQYAL